MERWVGKVVGQFNGADFIKGAFYSVQWLKEQTIEIPYNKFKYKYTYILKYNSIILSGGYVILTLMLHNFS